MKLLPGADFPKITHKNNLQICLEIALPLIPRISRAMCWLALQRPVWNITNHLFFNTLSPRPTGHHLANDISKFISFMKFILFHFKFHWFFPSSPVNTMPASVHIMAWRPAGDKQISKPMIFYFTDTYMRHRPHWRAVLLNYWFGILLYAIIYSGIVCNPNKKHYDIWSAWGKVKPPNFSSCSYFASVSAVGLNIAWHVIYHLSVEELIPLLCHAVTPQDPECHDN